MIDGRFGLGPDSYPSATVRDVAVTSRSIVVGLAGIRRCGHVVTRANRA